jgi:aminopeptidase N
MFNLRARLPKALAISGLILLLAVSSLPFPRQNPAARTSLPIQSPRTHDYDVQNYRIVIQFDWDKRSLTGETTITFRPLKNDLRELVIDAGQMTINRVRLAGGTSLTYRYEGGEKLLVKLDRQYPAGQDIAVTVDYTARQSKGLTFITPTKAEPTRPYQIWTQGEAEANHYWFPCYDHPDDKATSELIATIEKKYEVISNGALVEVKSNPAGTRTWHWKMDKPYSSYLISVVAGEFAQVKQSYKTIPIVSYVYPDQVQNATLSFKNLSRMMEFFSKQFGYEYPYPKYAQTTVRDFEGGGMENITATTLADTVVHDQRAQVDASSDGVVSHELAHSWFGDMVTCRDWSDLWLNESFATLSEAMWTESERGRDEYLYEMRSNQGTYFQAWFRGVRHPIVSRTYNDPDDLFDAYVYQRGAAVLNMLKFVLGDEMFWKAVRHYLVKYQWQNVDTSQLISAIQESTGQNLQWFFDEWVYKMGHPEFTIATTYDGTHALKVNVTQAVVIPSGADAAQFPRLFTMPVDIGITTTAGERIHRVLIDKLENEFTFEVDSKPLIVNFDRGNHLIKLVRSRKSDDELAYQVTHDADVMGRVNAATSLLFRSTEPVVNALSEAVLRDNFWGVRLEAARALSAIRTDACRAALLGAVKDKDSRVRAAAITGLGQLKDPRLADLFEKVIATDESYYVVAAAAYSLSGTGSPRAFGVLQDVVNQDSWGSVIRKWTLSGLIQLKDPRSLDLAIKYAAPSNPPAVRSFAFQLIGQVGKGNDKALEFLLKTLKDEPILRLRPGKRRPWSSTN